MRLLLDTSVLIDAARGRGAHLEPMLKAAQAGTELLTSAISVAELYAGMRLGEEKRTKALIDRLIFLPVTKEIAERGGDLVAGWGRKGRTLELTDMLIAATALEHGLSLMTGNRKDFPMPELTLFPPR